MSRILVIDDDEQLGRSIGRIVQRAGHEPRVVADLRAAEGVLPDFAPDLVIMEIQSSWFAGLTTFRTRLDAVGDHAVPLIFTVGRRELYRPIANVALPIDDWAGKPLDPEDFAPRITRALSRVRSSAA